MSTTRLVDSSTTLTSMTTIISIVHTKGGVGKTTSAIYLASAAARSGLETLVIDSDEQYSASVWADEAAQRGIGLPFTVTKNPNNVDWDSKELVLIDTPPGTSARIDWAVEQADLILIPCGCSPIEVERVWPTLEMTAGKPSAVLLTQVDLRAKLGAQVRALLSRESVPTLDTVIPQRQNIRKAFGTLPIDLGAYWDAWQELEAVVVGV
ncbi:ParA-like dsDNA partitioning protein [Mycobacterium phage LoneWolf]|nr:ParA-like dsDNA partitioning protein [Mycobacterium phage LoneWolf]